MGASVASPGSTCRSTCSDVGRVEHVGLSGLQRFLPGRAQRVELDGVSKRLYTRNPTSTTPFKLNSISRSKSRKPPVSGRPSARSRSSRVPARRPRACRVRRKPWNE